jgi:hypothetical protein
MLYFLVVNIGDSAGRREGAGDMNKEKQDVDACSHSTFPFSS